MSDILRVEGLSVTVQRPDGPLQLVREATFSVGEGQILALVGESGSGKSVTARTIMGLTQLDPAMRVGGAVKFRGAPGEDLLTLPPKEFRKLRGREMAMVFQEPMSALDPLFTIGSQLREALRRREKPSRKAEQDRLATALKQVGIADPQRVLRAHPHELSGGMCQRVMIAMALLAQPKLLLADEPTTALDVTIQAQILELIDGLRRDTGMAVVFVTHDMGVAALLSDSVAVMYAGAVVETAPTRELFGNPRHPYTSGLLGCAPTLTGPRTARLASIEGSVPAPGKLPEGCAFHPRCPAAAFDCRHQEPALAPADAGLLACLHPNSQTTQPTEVSA